MKKILNVTLCLLIFTAMFVACSKEKVVEGIYAPNGELISASMEELTVTIADALAMDKTNVSVKSISYQDVEKGFVAEIELHLAATDELTNVYYLSEKYAKEIKADSSVELISVSAENRSFSSMVAHCSCGSTSSSPSSGCRVSVTTGGGGTTGTCYSQGCSFGCVLHISTGNNR